MEGIGGVKEGFGGGLGWGVSENTIDYFYGKLESYRDIWFKSILRSLEYRILIDLINFSERKI